MMQLPRFKAAAVQAAPADLDCEATVAKAVRLVREAAGEGAPLIDREGIVYGEVDLGRCIQPKQMHDIVGHYNRFDIFDLRVNQRPLAPIVLDAAPDRATEPQDQPEPVAPQPAARLIKIVG